MRAAMKRERKLQDVLEIVGQHGLAPSVREAVRVQRDQHAAGDGEQPECDPRAEQRRQRAHIGRRVRRLRLHQCIDDAAEQDGLGELSRRECDVCDGENPAEPGLGPKQPQHTRIELKETHLAPGSVACAPILRKRSAVPQSSILRAAWPPGCSVEAIEAPALLPGAQTLHPGKGRTRTRPGSTTTRLPASLSPCAEMTSATASTSVAFVSRSNSSSITPDNPRRCRITISPK